MLFLQRDTTSVAFSCWLPWEQSPSKIRSILIGKTLDIWEPIIQLFLLVDPNSEQAKQKKAELLFLKVYPCNLILKYQFKLWAFMVQWLRALTFRHWISHRCSSSFAWGTCETPSSAPVDQVVFLWVLWFSPTSD